MSTWKDNERRVARRLHGARVPVADKRSGADVVNERLAIECKHRKQLPNWLHSAMSQAVKAARGEQLPIVVLHELNKRSDNDYVFLRLADFERLLMS